MRVAVFGFVITAILSLIGGVYLIALAHLSFAAVFGLILAGAEEKGGVMYALFWLFLALGTLIPIAGVVNFVL